MAETFRLGDDEVWNGFTLDVKAAHKRVKVHPSEQGLLLFRVKGRTFFYQVCHFGGKFSAYWWSRVAALLIRVLHHSIYIKHGEGGLICADDFIWALPDAASPAVATLISMLLIAVGCPIS